ncbi:B12-binding domain-containing radical SAM protein [Methanobrevibacter sp. 87.7]|nr:radical SAM protein [Methanobrevibacter sp. 87.7]OWT32790.1 B12-binding domain-containing radical SAM protein [Methanobrevibacter sp. 87.7]
MKITFINPPQTASKYKFMGVIAPPLGMSYIAAVLEKNDYDVSIIDACALDYTLEQLSDRVKEENPDIVSISALTPTIGSALESAQVVKETIPETKVILGGYHPTFNFEETIHDENVDLVIRGEGEYTMLDLVQTIEKGGDLSKVKGIVYEEENDNGDKIMIVTPDREPIMDLDEFPFPALHLLPMDHYKLLNMDTHMSTMITSRGCPVQCSFCSSAAMHGRKIRRRSIKNIVDEMEHLKYDYGIETIAFMDDTFTINKKRVKDLCNEIMNRNLDMMWGCTARVDTLNEEVLDKMKQAGCICIFMGVESAAQDVLDRMGKRTNINKIKEAFKIAREKKIRTIASVALGMPGDTKKAMNKTIKFVHSLKPNYAIYSLATPYPGTRFYKEAFEKNLIKVKDWSKFTLISPILDTIDCSVKDLRKIQAKAFIKFYLRPHYLIREFLIDGPMVLKTFYGVIKQVFTKMVEETQITIRETYIK